MSVIVVDLDNCISDDNWRISHINEARSDFGARWHDYHSLAGFDQRCNEHLTRDAAERQVDVVILTGRPIAYAAITREWLKRNRIGVRALAMRNNDDRTPSAQLKLAQLRWLYDTHGIALKDVVACYDDKPSVVEAYRSIGLRGEVVAINERSWP